MRATELIGKNAVRTAPIYEMVMSGFMFGGGYEKQPLYAFTTSPIKILKATDSHIVYESENSKQGLLDCRYCDDNWVDYDELMNVSNESGKDVLEIRFQESNLSKDIHYYYGFRNNDIVTSAYDDISCLIKDYPEFSNAKIIERDNDKDEEVVWTIKSIKGYTHNDKRLYYGYKNDDLFTNAYSSKQDLITVYPQFLNAAVINE